jgi:xanthine dehydrogenase YagR molybdenum-binding subunit
MPEYKWPEANDRDLIGKRISRLDGPFKVTGVAKYTYDVKRPGILYTKSLCSPHAHARIKSLDTSAAAQMPGVKAVRVIQEAGAEIQWALDEIVAVAATSEEAAEDAVRAIKIEYEVLPHFVKSEQVDAPEARAAQENIVGDPDGGKSSATVTSQGYYGLPSVAHCCMEPHGQVCEWTDEQNLTAWCTTQGVSTLPGQFGEGLGIPASNVRVLTPYMGGGFGSKFSADRWGIECARLAKETNAPVKWMLERDAEMTVAGDRPSAYAEIEVGAQQDGTIVYWASKSWGSGGRGGSGSPPLPYVFTNIPNRRHQHISIPTHVAAARAWRAPNHPQACFLTMAAMDDLAAALKMDPLQFFEKNLVHVQRERATTYAEQLRIGADLIGWKSKWHARGDSGRGPIKKGLGLGLHTWGGLGHQSNCEISIHPDGSVEAKLGSQDLGTGTKTVIAIVLAETFGLPLEAVKVSIGDSSYPASGASGGSTTVGGVSASTRRAAQNALEELFAKVAPELGVGPEQLEAEQGTIRVKADPSKNLSWKQAASHIGVTPLTVRGANPGAGKLIDQGVGGIQMAEVSVDVETGIVKMEKLVAVQDCGLIIDLKTAESQMYGGMIMGISYSLTEEKVTDPVTGRMLNANMEFYKLSGIGDVGELVVHMMTGPEHDSRGVIGLGEPPVISPGAAISNAVANAIGVRVPYLPLTPDRVLAALEKGGLS